MSIAGICAAGGTGYAAAPVAALPMTLSKPGAKVDFEQDVYPILKANCIACHNKTTTKADLNMETPALMKKGGESGAGIVPGKAADSLIFQAAQHTWDSTMPPKGNKVGAVNLKPEELGLLKLWIDQGAKGELKKQREFAWQPLPAGLNPIYATAMTPDGRWAACSRANQVFVYDLGTRQLVARLTDPALIAAGLYKQAGVAHRDLVQSLAFSPDGMRLASGSHREVKIWKRQVVVDADAARSPFPSPSADERTKMLADLKIDPASVIAVRGDWKRLAAGGADGIVRVWDVAAKKSILEINKDLAAQRAQDALQWEIARQQLEAAFQGEFSGKTGNEVKQLDDRLKKSKDAIAAGKKSIEEKKKAVPAAQAAKVAAEKVVAAVGAEIAKAAAGKPDAALEKKKADADDKLAKAIKAESDALAAVKTAEGQAADAEAEVKLIDAAKIKAAETIAVANAALAAANKLLTQYKADAAKPATLDPKRDAIKTLAFSDDGLTLTAVTVSGAAKMWSAETGAPLEPPPASRGHFIWVLERTIGGMESPLVDRVNALQFSPDGKLLATGSGEPSRSGDITLWDVSTGKAMQTWREKHTDAVLSLAFSPDGKLLASGGGDKAARVFEVPGGKLVRNLEGHTHHVLGVAFRADGRVLATAGADNVVKIWDMLTGDRRKNIDGWDKEVTSINFLGATDQIVTSAGDNRLRLVKDAGAEVRSIAGLPDFMHSAATTRRGNFIIGGGEDSVLRLWEAESGKELAVFGPE